MCSYLIFGFLERTFVLMRQAEVTNIKLKELLHIILLESTSWILVGLEDEKIF